MLRTGCLLAPQRDFVVTLRQSGLPYRRPPATALLGHYAGRTLTGKFITAFRTHTTATSEAVGPTFECAAQRLNVNSDWYILEPVDDRDRPVPLGSSPTVCW